MSSFVLRPIIMNDLDQLKVLIEGMADPIASLPDNKAVLKKRIHLAAKSFKKTENYQGTEYYLFVLEDVQTKEIVGASAINATVGGQNFFFVYEIQKEKFSYPRLDILKTVDVLHFKKISKGPSELCSLYLKPECRRKRLGTLLSLGRFFYMHAFPKKFSENIIVNLKGIRDEKGDSPFWKSIGEVFFGANLTTVDTMKSLGYKMFIRALMPRHPLYIPLLRLKAQEAIGQVELDTQPAYHLLTKEGFKKNEWIDIFDAGPFVIAPKKEVRTIQNIASRTVGKIIDIENGTEPGKYLIANSNNSLDFRVSIGNITLVSNGTVNIDSNIANALKVDIGSVVSFFKY